MIVVNKSACLFLHRCTRLSTNVKILRLWMVVVILIRLSDRLHACLSVNSSIWKCVTWPVGHLVLFWPRVQLCADEKLLQCFPAVTYLWPKFSYYLNCPTFYTLSSCRSLSPFAIFAKLNVVTVQHITVLLFSEQWNTEYLFYTEGLMPPISPLINTAPAWTLKYENIHNMESEILVRNEQKRDI